MATTTRNTKGTEMIDTRLNERDGQWTAEANGKTGRGESITAACRQLARRLRVAFERLEVTTDITHD